MKEYMPTTEGVRDTYVRAHRTLVARVEFDRWLAVVKAEAWEEGKEYGDKRANREVHFQPNPYREGENSE